MKESIKKIILEAILKISSELELEINDIEVTRPEHSEHGDYSSNVSLRLAKDLKRSPMQIAEEIVKNIDGREEGEFVQNFERIESIKPGFINFTLGQNYKLEKLKEIIFLGDKYGSNEFLKGQTILVEFTDPNPFKVLHIGHLFTNMIGESLSRLLEAQGADVKRINYQGDVGLHVAKTMWGINEKLAEEKLVWDDIKKLKLEDRVAFLGEAYALGNKSYEPGVGKASIESYNQIIFAIAQEKFVNDKSEDYKKYFSKVEANEGEIREWYFEGREWCLEYFEIIYKRVDTTFDLYTFESEVSGYGMKFVLENVSNGVFVKDDGAIIFKGDDYGLHTRVFVNSKGLPTYEAKELGLAKYKSEKFNFNRSIIITAEEQSNYFKVVLKALEQIESELAKKTEHLAHGLVKLPGAKKMSSRAGSILGAEWLLDEIQEKIKNVMNESGRTEGVEEVSDKLAVAAVKYGFLRSTIGSDVVFDLDNAIKFDGDTGPYVMYAYTRGLSILSKVGDVKLEIENAVFDSAELDLINKLNAFGDEVLLASNSYAPSRIVAYLFSLAQSFNHFYQDHNVSESKGDELSKRVAIVKATTIVLKKGLNLLGIRVVERM